MQLPRPARLASWQMHLICWSGGVLWATGICWLLLHYCFRLKGEFGPQANPAEPWMLRLHGLAMVASLLGLGSLLVSHVRKGWHYRHQRLVGGLLAGVLGVLILTGYLLYYVGDEGVRDWISASHWVLRTGLPILFIVHFLRGYRLFRQPPPGKSQSAPRYLEG